MWSGHDKAFRLQACVYFGHCYISINLLSAKRIGQPGTINILKVVILLCLGRPGCSVTKNTLMRVVLQ